MTDEQSTGPYSSVRRAAGLVFLMGEVAFDEDGNAPEGIAAQTQLVCERISATLKGEGLELSDVVAVAAHLANRGDFAAFNAEYSRHFKPPYPVRTTVCAQLVDEVLVEITVTAAERK